MKKDKKDTPKTQLSLHENEESAVKKTTATRVQKKTRKASVSPTKEATQTKTKRHKEGESHTGTEPDGLATAATAAVVDADVVENDEDVDANSFDTDDFDAGNFDADGFDVDGFDADDFDADTFDTDSLNDKNIQDNSTNTLPVIARAHLPVAAGTKDSLHLYMKEISRFPMLKPDEEHMLAKRVRDHGDTDAAFRLVSSHLRLVVKIAMDFQRRWMQNVLDLVQEGNVGLMRAVNKFDPDKGIKFSYYAAFWIKAYILKFIMNNWRMVKIGTTQVQRKLFYNLNKERQKLISQGFDPDAAMLSEKLGVSVEQINEMDQRLGSSDMSLDLPISDESGGATRMDFLPALGPGVEESFASNEIAKLVQEHLRTILPKLNEKETFILQKRLLSDEPMTLREIGERYNVTRERVRQLEARLLEKLRAHLSSDIQDFSEEWITN